MGVKSNAPQSLTFRLEVILRNAKRYRLCVAFETLSQGVPAFLSLNVIYGGSELSCKIRLCVNTVPGVLT